MILTFGEIMLRLTPMGRLRLRQAIPGTMTVTLGGGEANVAAALAALGMPARYVTALPRNVLSECVIGELRGLGVDTSSIAFTAKGRVGLYLIEAGANQRSSVVVYDREGSSIALTPPESYRFDEALEGVTWVHVTGITPAISETAFLSTLALVRLARERGIRVSCDLNFRRKLWGWRTGVAPAALAKECMSAILPFVDIVIGNEEDAKDVFGIAASGTSVETGRINAQAYEEVAKELARQFPNLTHVAVTLRESYGADYNNWGGLLYDTAARRTCLAPLDAEGRYKPYEIHDIVDRVGGGDAFCAGLIFGLNHPAYREPQTALRFAAAASCLKHSIEGDFNVVSEEEVVTLMRGAGSGRVRR